MLFPETAAKAGEGDSEDEAPGSRSEEDASESSAPESPLVEAGDAVATVAAPEDAPADAAPALEFDLAPAARALAGLVQAGAARRDEASQNQSLKIRVSQENDDLKLTVPRQAAELLKGLGPLLDALAKLVG